MKPKRSKTKYYMHTLDGKPAIYDGDQLVFGYHGMPIDQFPTTLKQLRDEQRASMDYRGKRGYIDWARYGYIRING